MKKNNRIKHDIGRLDALFNTEIGPWEILDLGDKSFWTRQRTISVPVKVCIQWVTEGETFPGTTVDHIPSARILTDRIMDTRLRLFGSNASRPFTEPPDDYSNAVRILGGGGGYGYNAPKKFNERMNWRKDKVTSTPELGPVCVMRIDPGCGPINTSDVGFYDEGDLQRYESMIEELEQYANQATVTTDVNSQGFMQLPY